MKWLVVEGGGGRERGTERKRKGKRKRERKFNVRKFPPPLTMTNLHRGTCGAHK
ncbi:hypothetical protein A2U01_0030747, partial [Trifolium medium]|nr:hypothetical protein [Trifolium medium]